MPSAVSRQPHIRSPDEVTASVRPLPTPLLWRRSDSKRRFGVKSEPLGVLRRPHPSERSCRQTEPVRNLTLSNYIHPHKAGLFALEEDAIHRSCGHSGAVEADCEARVPG